MQPRWWRWFLLPLFIASLLWRALVLARLAGGPLLAFLNADSAIYWDWAGTIRAGHWISSSPFFFGPLYAYWLAIVRTLFGDGIPAVLWVQAVLGSAAVVFLADAMRRITRPWVAATVGVVLAGQAMPVLFDLLVLMESLIYFLGALALWLMVRDHRRSPPLVGLLIGLMALGRPIFLLLLLPYGLYLVGKRRPHATGALVGLLAIPVGVTLLTGFHQLRTCGAWLPFTYSGGFNAYVGNGPHANGTFVPFTDAYGSGTPATEGAGGNANWDGRAYLEATGVPHMGPCESSRYWTTLTWRFVAGHPWRTARLFAKKLLLLFNHREVPQIIDPEVYERAVGPLGWPLVWGFALLGIAGLAGAFGAWRQGPEARLMLGCLVVLSLGTAAFFVVDRYRVHLLPYLAALAALGVTAWVEAWRSRGVRGLAPAGIALAIAATVICAAPLVPFSSANAEWMEAATLGEAWLDKGDATRAVSWLERAVTLDRSGTLRGAETLPGRLARAGTYELLGEAYDRVGDSKRALASLETAVRLVPEASTTQLELADELSLNGAFARAADAYEAAGLSRHQAAERLTARAAGLERGGDAGATRKYLEAAVGLEPAYEQAVVPLIRLDIMSGNLDGAESRLRAAESRGLDVNVARAHEAWIHMARGDTAAAERLLQAIPPEVRSGDPRIRATVELMKRASTETRRP